MFILANNTYFNVLRYYISRSCHRYITKHSRMRLGQVYLPNQFACLLINPSMTMHAQTGLTIVIEFRF